MTEFSYEYIPAKGEQGEDDSNYRISDKDGNRIATCYLKENAEIIVSGLNAIAALAAALPLKSERDSMTNLSRDEVLKVAQECGFEFDKYGCIQCDIDGSLDANDVLERFAAAMYAKGAEDMRERAAIVCEEWHPHTFARHVSEHIRNLPITPEGEQG